MPTMLARRLCPKLIVLPGDFEKYEQFSRWMFSYAYDFTPDVEISSIDEGYFDLSRARKPPATIAETIRGGDPRCVENLRQRRARSQQTRQPNRLQIA